MTKPIRALLLAAGLGTRLRPITDNIPKCLVPIGGQPLLERWLISLEKVKCEETTVNTHYLAEQVDNFFRKRKRSQMKIKTKYEPNLLGTGGTLMANKEFFEESTGLIIHADNVTDFDIKNLLEAHENRPKNCVMTMLTFNTNDPSSCGIVETNKLGIIQSFHEKVLNPPSNKANAGIYAFNSELLVEMEKIEEPNDLCNQVFPYIIDKIYTHHTNNMLIDIGTEKKLLEAQALWL